MQETRVWFLGQKDAPEKGMASHSSILARKILWTKEPGGPQPRGSHGVKTQLSNIHFPENRDKDQHLLYSGVIMEAVQGLLWWPSG